MDVVGAAAADRLALRLDPRRSFPAVGRAPPRSELLARDFRSTLCFVCSVAGPQETESNCVSTIMGWSSAGRAQPACASSGSLGRGIVSLKSVAADPAGGSDHSVSGMDVLSRGPVPLGVPVFDDPHSSRRLQPDHVSAATTCVEGCQCHFALDGRASPERGQRNHPSSHGVGGSRCL